MWFKQCNLIASFLTTEKWREMMIVIMMNDRDCDDECCEFRIMHQIKFESFI